MLLGTPGLWSAGCSQATLLGTPIGGIECIDDTIRRKTEALKLMGERLSLLQAHDALLLLRHSFSIPKILYTFDLLHAFNLHN